MYREISLFSHSKKIFSRMNKPTRYPIGIQSFEKLRTGGFAYVDKTALVYELANTVNYGFLGRPRRFGKSLLISTLKAYFEGKRELFKGLAIEQMEKEWTTYPVLHIDLNAKRYKSVDDLLAILNMHLERWEREYGRDPLDVTSADRFTAVIRKAYEQTGQRVVVLVDEYDKPMVNNLDNEPLADEYRDTLKAFYGVLKSCDQYIRFAMLTGVTKFSKVSVFSDLNNLDDISLWRKYNSVCGLTESEIRANFGREVCQLAEANQMTEEECYAELRRRYDGYHFCDNTEGVYNPFSVLNTLSKQAFGNYWFETGTPTLLLNVLKNTQYDLYKLADEEVSAQTLGSVETMRTNPIPIIYQSGYLTIKGYDREFQVYRMGFPNIEVEEGFVKYLLPHYVGVKEGEEIFAIRQFLKEVCEGHPEQFMQRLMSMMADTHYAIVGDAELYFQNFLFLFFRLLGLYVEVEHATSGGRTDMVVKTAGYIYIFEFKLDGSADEALKQIDDRGYALPYAADPRKQYKIGANFSSEKRRLEEWKVACENR